MLLLIIIPKQAKPVPLCYSVRSCFIYHLAISLGALRGYKKQAVLNQIIFETKGFTLKICPKCMFMLTYSLIHLQIKTQVIKNVHFWVAAQLLQLQSITEVTCASYIFSFVLRLILVPCIRIFLQFWNARFPKLQRCRMFVLLQRFDPKDLDILLCV